MATRKVKSAGRFGSRYGKTVRQKVANIEAKQKKKQQCPYCRKHTVQRVSVGIWLCNKCGEKFAGRAYEV